MSMDGGNCRGFAVFIAPNPWATTSLFAKCHPPGSVMTGTNTVLTYSEKKAWSAA